ncbi:MAG: two-component system, chemotaxis family, protein-glutamate methylesterase/glutaminase [Frankiaceae bacterium]|nr:two-component system, chemotaxis family, protein-glutamate methylesterase/glutaminase [Frankiaceae bacterium]
MTVSPPPAPAGSGGGQPLTVVIVDDSAVQRRFARAAIEADANLTVVGEARNGRDAIAMVDRLRPNAVLMDLHLPVMNGIEAIERIMATRPTPILVYSSFVDGDDRDNAAAALAAGAVDVMEKPGDAGRLDEFAESLRRRIRVAGRVKVITHPRGRLGGPAATMSTRRLGGPARRADAEPATHRAPATKALDGLGRRDVRLIAIGASTGGPHALSMVLAELPADLEAAVVVVQHMADGFIEGLAAWLDTLCALPVAVGANGRRLVAGTVTVAPSGLNLIVHDQLRVTTHEPPKTQYHVPGIDATLTSVAECMGAAAVGVLLTGMGRDGALGLKKMRDRGSFTIAQDEETSAVYGMPAAAMALGAADLELPLSEVGPALRQLTAAPVIEVST